MAKNLVIVESPTKAKTLERYLGSDFRVLASYGHVRDLPRSDFAIEVAGGDGVSLRYEIPKSSSKHVNAIRKEARGADRVFLATDLDREGEAIAWHVAEVAGIDTDDENRVVFAEITRDAILSAFERPRRIDAHLVDAQQARRAVDRIVGYRLSPTLWRNVASGISAGRVQSVALRLICDREDEIRRFVAQDYWSLHGNFARDGASVATQLHTVDGARVTDPKKLQEQAGKGREGRYLVIADAQSAEALAERSRAVRRWTVTDVKRREAKRNPQPPFTTSTLQQEAERKLGFSPSRTMRLAQQLYEGINVGDETVGLITYMRTDSLNISDTALGEIAELVRGDFGARYALDKPRRYKGKAKGAQEAHEAIRPTSVARRPEALARRLDADQRALYDLIYKRTVASQMAPAVFDTLRADIVGGEGGDEPEGGDQPGDGRRSRRPEGGDQAELRYRASGQVLRFDGYLAVYEEGRDEDDADEQTAVGDRLPDLEDGQLLTLTSVRGEQHTTSPPPRYTGASLVKVLESEGIGRPSTYASIIGVLLNREYVRTESRRFFPTPLGEVVVAYLKQHFAEVVDVSFTARMEDELDEIAEGHETWGKLVADFLGEVDDWIAERKPERPRIPIEDATCPECGEAMEKVFSGKSRQWFASCHRWPDCKGTLPLDTYGNVTTVEQLRPDPDVECPECGKPMIRRDGRFGPFYGCQDYPACKGIVNVEQRIGFACPTCGKGHMTQRMSRYGKPFYGCNRYPECDFAMWTQPLARPCPSCGGPLKPPRRNAKNPVAVCANCEQRVPVEADPPRAEPEEFVPARARVTSGQ
ncbi:MAG: type I DNA topoisomerase [Euzebyales bacterium]|nr:type I DNA topoisomerase [Euzebyales bacterium]MBA3622458.1 type I DNA topoisomerase [Euzebyales bacterium]